MDRDATLIEYAVAKLNQARTAERSAQNVRRRWEKYLAAAQQDQAPEWLCRSYNAWKAFRPKEHK